MAAMMTGDLKARNGAVRHLLMLVFLLTLSAVGDAKPTLTPRELDLARNYVFASCVIAQGAADGTTSDAKVWAGSIVDEGHLSAASYIALNALAKRLAASDSHAEVVATNLQRCFESVTSPGFEEDLRKELSAE